MSDSPPLEVLIIGYGGVAQNSLDAMSRTIQRRRGKPPSFYVTVATDQDVEHVQRSASCSFANTRADIRLEVLGRQDLEEQLNPRGGGQRKEYDFVHFTAASPGDGDAELCFRVDRALGEAGIDTDRASPDFRYGYLKKNWGVVSRWAELFRKHDAAPLVDIYSNPTDMLAYLWASITQRPRRVMGNNHIDTIRLRTQYQALAKAYLGAQDRSIVGKRLEGAIVGGHHSGGATPLLEFGAKGSHANRSDHPDLNSVGFLKYLQEKLITTYQDLSPFDRNARQGFSTIEGLFAHLLGEERENLGMSIFLELSRHPLFRNHPGLPGQDRGTFLGYAARIRSGPFHGRRRLVWDRSDPNPADARDINDFSKDSLVHSYATLHALQDSLIKQGLLRPVEWNEEDETLVEELHNDTLRVRSRSQRAPAIIRWTGDDGRTLVEESLPERHTRETPVQGIDRQSFIREIRETPNGVIALAERRTTNHTEQWFQTLGQEQHIIYEPEHVVNAFDVEGQRLYLAWQGGGITARGMDGGERAYRTEAEYGFLVATPAALFGAARNHVDCWLGEDRKRPISIPEQAVSISATPCAGTLYAAIQTLEGGIIYRLDATAAEPVRRVESEQLAIGRRGGALEVAWYGERGLEHLVASGQTLGTGRPENLGHYNAVFDLEVRPAGIIVNADDGYHLVGRKT